MKRMLNQLPEHYLMLILLLGAYSPPFSFNPLLLGLAGLVAAQAIYRKKLPGLVLSSLFVIGNILFLMAVLSELSEFTSITTEAWQLIIVGLSLFMVNLFVSGHMLYKYLKMRPSRGSRLPSAN